MIWQGKAIGALIGLLVGGPFGALVGVLLGTLFDSYLSDANESRRVPRASASVQEAFFRATFQVMGHIAKADGRVSEADIHAARRMMGELGLGERELQAAMALFREGKARDFPLEGVLGPLHDLCRDRPDLCRMFVQIQVHAAVDGDSLNEAGRKVLARVCAALGISGYEVIQMEALRRMQRAMREPRSAPVDRVAQAHEVLGIARDASDSDVTKAYRRLMNHHHPDKLVAKGLPESMMRLAQEKTHQIRAAYEVIREARGMK
jgi:DnaJ like chaperone protein